jgi:hypothetical protein
VGLSPLQPLEDSVPVLPPVRTTYREIPAGITPVQSAPAGQPAIRFQAPAGSPPSPGCDCGKKH